MVEYQVDTVTNQYESGIVHAPFDEAVTLLDARGHRIIDVKTQAQLRIQEGQNSPVTDGNWVRNELVYCKGGRSFLTLGATSPILMNPRDAVIVAKAGKPFYITMDQVEQARQNSVKLPNESMLIPYDRFGEEELTARLFEEVASDYGVFAREILQYAERYTMIHVIDKSFVDSQENPFVFPMWFGELIGGGPYLHDDGHALAHRNWHALKHNYALRGILSLV